MSFNLPRYKGSLWQDVHRLGGLVIIGWLVFHDRLDDSFAVYFHRWLMALLASLGWSALNIAVFFVWNCIQQWRADKAEA